jgi:hypothetical protein
MSTVPARSAAAGMPAMSDSVIPRLHRLETGELFRIKLADLLPPEHRDRFPYYIYFFQHCIDRIIERMGGEPRVNEPGLETRYARQIIRELLARELRAITRRGALTRRWSPRRRRQIPASIDFVIIGPLVSALGLPVEGAERAAQNDEGHPVVASLIVRPIDAADEELEAVDGKVYIAITLTRRAPMWIRILLGERIMEGHDTYLIAAGECFEPRLHTDYLGTPPHYLFRRPPH